MAIQLSTTARNAMMDAITTTVGTSATIRLYSGTAPATVGTSLSGNTLLAELACSSTFAPSASSGVLTLNSITNDSSADASGTASFFRVYKSDGTTAVIQGTVGTSGADLNLVSTSITSTQPVQITSFTLTAPGA
jgi:hypothetical protein